MPRTPSRPHWLSMRVLAAGWVLCLGIAGAASAQQSTKLAILPIVVHSAESPDYLRNGLSDMLASRFEASGRFRLIRMEAIDLATTEIEEARESAVKVGADYVLFGSFTQFGRGASLDMQCAPTEPGPKSKPLREIFVHSGSIGDIIPDLDDLVGKVTRYVSGGGIPQSGPVQPLSAPAGVDSGNGAEIEELLLRVESLETRLDDFEASAEPSP